MKDILLKLLKDAHYNLDVEAFTYQNALGMTQLAEAIKIIESEIEESKEEVGRIAKLKILLKELDKKLTGEYEQTWDIGLISKYWHKRITDVLDDCDE